MDQGAGLRVRLAVEWLTCVSRADGGEVRRVEGGREERQWGNMEDGGMRMRCGVRDRKEGEEKMGDGWRSKGEEGGV